MFKEFFKEYLPRSYSMNGQHDMQITYLIGNVLVFAGCCVMAGIMIYLYFFKKKKGMVMYPSLISFFLNVALICSMNVLAIWHNYLWITTALWLLLGFIFIWMVGQIPQGMDDNKRLKDCETLREDYEKLLRDSERMANTIKTLKKNDFS